MAWVTGSGSDGLFSGLFGRGAVAVADRDWLQAMLDTEAALARALEGGDLTPVMARLGPADLETLDTLITAGFAANRAQALMTAIRHGLIEYERDGIAPLAPVPGRLPGKPAPVAFGRGPGVRDVAGTSVA